MQLTLLSSKGQVIIPKALRDAHDWQVGTRLEVIDTVEGVLLKPVVARQTTALPEGLAAIRSRVAYKGPAVSLKDMNAAVLQEAKNRNQN
ncbi:AbrB/MazE/SpoVT family DNA-binding domain-containing protein [Rhodoferax sp. BLA1]|uniref:AbrB/MazE/SpoVT family DNA-binding domain-containing protein n=1 Tax=Rhodoferax sp. BLA1 TaxID=2576062 RepID=UPI0015D0D681|nr:AbrB/MazE/SpoVT family DNA-binding domain-containing protein [Rhodoferax sp. BLA1]